MEGNVEVDLEFFYDSHPVVLSSFGTITGSIQTQPLFHMLSSLDTITGCVQTQPLFQLLSCVFQSYARSSSFV